MSKTVQEVLLKSFSRSGTEVHLKELFRSLSGSSPRKCLFFGSGVLGFSVPSAAVIFKYSVECGAAAKPEVYLSVQAKVLHLRVQDRREARRARV